MTRIQRLMKLHRLMDAAGEGGSDAGGTGSGQGGQGAGAGEGGEGQGGEGENSGSGDGSGQGGEGDKGGAKPSDAEAKLLKEVMTKKTALEAATAELNRVKEQLKAFEGIDATAVRALLTEKEEAERKKAEAAGDYEKLKKQMAESHATEKAALQSQIEASNGTVSTLQQKIAELTVGSAFSTSSFIANDLALPLSKARVLYGSHFEFKDDAVVGYDKPAGAADRAPLVDAAGNPLPFDVALKKIVDADPDKEALYRSKMKPGAGSSTQKASKAPKQVDASLTGRDRIAAGLKLAKEQASK